MDDDELFKAMTRSILDGEAEVAAELARRSLDEGIDPLEAIDRGFLPGVTEVGDDFGAGLAFLPELVMAGAAMKAAIAVLEPEMIARGTSRERFGTVVLATVRGDVHDIGKSLVGTILTAHGFRVVDLGVDVAPEAIVDAVRSEGADIVGLSSLLTTTMPAQAETIRALEAAGLRSRVKVLVGGAPVTLGWAQEVGADAYGEDASVAVATARRLLRPGEGTDPAT
ncbi:MAG: B12-binding domain-containing protein [Actinomycetota bacterium]